MEQVYVQVDSRIARISSKSLARGLAALSRDYSEDVTPKKPSTEIAEVLWDYLLNQLSIRLLSFFDVVVVWPRS
eukprot:229827-Amphidinium_carterae.1